jgi:uncharacterized protein YkwD
MKTKNQILSRRFGTRCLAFVMAFLVCAGMLFTDPVTAQAASDTIDIPIAVTYKQESARSMFDMINEWRTSDTWQWNAAGEKETVSGRSALVYDYELEKIAMQRAIELAISFSHTRPNGTSCFTAYTSEVGNGFIAENIAMGQTDASNVFQAWQEENCDYSGQGHRRNMLNSSYRAVGIAHIVYRGINYWVQEFSSVVSDTAETEANESSDIASVSVLDSSITGISVFSDGVLQNSISLENGASLDLSKITIAILYNTSSYRETQISDWTVSVADESIISCTDDALTGVSLGTTEITFSALGRSVTLEATVTEPAEKEIDPDLAEWLARPDMVDAIIEPIPDQTYTGKAIKPSVTVTYNGNTLTYLTDYLLVYHDNTEVGTATVEIIGLQPYKNTRITTFNIVPASEEDPADTPDDSGNIDTPDQNDNIDIPDNSDSPVNPGTNTPDSSDSPVDPGTDSPDNADTADQPDTDTPSDNTGTDITTPQVPSASALKASVVLRASSKTLKKGKTYQIRFKKTLNKNYVKTITYKSSNKKAASVSKNGKVTAKKKGSASIKCKVVFTTGASKTVTFKVKVKNK